MAKHRRRKNKRNASGNGSAQQHPYERPPPPPRPSTPSAESESSPADLFTKEEEVKDIINIFYLAFQAAVEEAPRLTISSCTEIDMGVEDGPTFYELEDVPGDINRSLPEDMPQLAKDGYPYLALCGIGTGMVIKVLEEQLSRHGVSVEWIKVSPAPKIVMFRPGVRDIGEHAILKIVLPCGKRFVADFTCAQFGHDKDSWWCEFDEYLDKFTDLSTSYKEVTKENEDGVEWMLGDRLNGYWGRAKTQYEIFFKDLKWDLVKEKGEEWVSQRAIAKFSAIEW